MFQPVQSAAPAATAQHPRPTKRHCSELHAETPRNIGSGSSSGVNATHVAAPAPAPAPAPITHYHRTGVDRVCAIDLKVRRCLADADCRKFMTRPLVDRFSVLQRALFAFLCQEDTRAKFQCSEYGTAHVRPACRKLLLQTVFPHAFPLLDRGKFAYLNCTFFRPHVLVTSADTFSKTRSELGTFLTCLVSTYASATLATWPAATATERAVIVLLERVQARLQQAQGQTQQSASPTQSPMTQPPSVATSPQTPCTSSPSLSPAVKPVVKPAAKPVVNPVVKPAPRPAPVLAPSLPLAATAAPGCTSAPCPVPRAGLPSASMSASSTSACAFAPHTRLHIPPCIDVRVPGGGTIRRFCV